MINKWYEISCDYCHSAQQFSGNIKLAESQFRDYGGIVTKNGKHYCDKKCKRKAKP